LLLEEVRSVLFPTGRQAIALLLGSAALVLLIGCANLSNVLIAQTRSRERDLAVRAALGASYLRLIRPILLETMMVGVAASAVALAAIHFLSGVLLRQVPPSAYGRAFVGFDIRVVAFAVLLSLAAGLLLAVLPAARLWRLDVQAIIRRTSARAAQARAFGRPFLVVQVAIAVVLLAGAWTATRTLIGVLNEPLGFDATDVLVVQVDPAVKEGGLPAFYEAAIRSVSQLGYVTAAGAGSQLPHDTLAAREAAATSVNGLGWRDVLPGYMEALRMRLREGRLPVEADKDGDLETAVLSESAARVMFPARSAVGETVEVSAGRTARIVGVVQDEVSGDVTGRAAYIVWRGGNSLLKIVVRTHRQENQMAAEIRRKIAELVPSNSPVTVRWMGASLDGLDTYRGPRFQTLVLGAFSVLAIALTAIGVFAVVAGLVVARTRELGVRLALGADSDALVRLILWEAIRPVSIGVVLGVCGVVWAASLPLVQSAGMEPSRLETLLLAGCVVALVGIFAAYLPTRRIARLDPVTVLRAE
jgi:predicted permease